MPASLSAGVPIGSLATAADSGGPLSLLPPLDPELRRSALPVTTFDVRLRRQVAALFAVMRRERSAALAATQVGLGSAIVVADVGAAPVALANPVLHVVVTSESLEWETCLSAPGRWQVLRADGVVVTGTDDRGRNRHLLLEGGPARRLQHAVDHLHGRLPSDRAVTVAPQWGAEQPYSGPLIGA